MSSRSVTAFAIDDDNEEKFAQHGLSARQVIQVLDGDHVLVPNRARRRAKFLVIGRDHGGKCIAIPIEPTHDETVWRPVTAWPCKHQEEAWLKAQG